MNPARDRPSSVAVRVPGSTSNCGAGFDTLGLAVRLYNTVTLALGRGGEERGTAAAVGATIRAGGDVGKAVGTGNPGAGPKGEARVLPQDERDARAAEMAASAAGAYFAAVGRLPESFEYHIDGDVPAARGLGSSVTVIAGIVAGLDALYGTALSRAEMVRLVTAEEGHPDNASAGVLGGFCVSRCDPQSGGYLDTVKFEVPESIALVVASPEVELLTKESRGVLPRTLPYFDAVKSINSAAYVVAAFASGNFARLRNAAGDFLHEPYRLPKIPGAAEAIAAGVKAGAYTGWLSGSGSSVLCVAERTAAEAVSRAMVGAFAAAGVAATGRALAADNHGLRVG